MFLNFFIPYRKKQYVLTIPEKAFIQKIEYTEKKLQEEYQPGKYYLIHNSSEHFFIFKNIKFQTSKESGVISRFNYTFSKEKTIVTCTFRYASIFYWFLPVLLLFFSIIFYHQTALNILSPIVGYTLFCLPLHLEAWVVTEEFKTLFEKEIDLQEATVPLS